MSDDLRYYFFDDEADDHPSIPSAEGWQQMQQLLDAELPLLSKKRPRRYVFFIAGILTAIILLTTALPLKNDVEQHNTLSISKNDVASKTAENITTEQNENNNNKIATTKLSGQYQSINPFIEKSQASMEFNDVVSGLHNSNTLNDILINEHNSKKNFNETIPAYTSSDYDTVNGSVNKSANGKEETTALNTQQKKTTKNIYKDWHLNGGLAENISLSNTTQALHPYPFAELQYQFAPRFFAAVSVALFSPVGSNANGITKTVYLNDTSADVSRYNEKLNYNKLSYADLSLTAGIKLTKQLSVQSGVQLSRLLNTKTSTSLDPYDFDSNRVFITDVGTLAPTPSAAPVYNNKIEAHKLDIRYVAGITYDIKKFSFSMQYQACINPVLKGTTASPDKNKLITLRAAYRFK